MVHTTGPGRLPVNLSDAVLLTLHMVWTDTEEDQYPGLYDWGVKSSTFPPEGSMSTTRERPGRRVAANEPASGRQTGKNG